MIGFIIVFIGLICYVYFPDLGAYLDGDFNKQNKQNNEIKEFKKYEMFYKEKKNVNR
jgi:hypothetical protein